jgi:hypothetical protein
MADPDRPHIEGPVHCEVLRNDSDQPLEPLAGFCCGSCSKDPSAAEVNETAARLVAGGSLEEGGAVPQHVVLLLDRHDTLLGIASVRPEGAVRLDPVPYLNGYGREKRLARHTLADQKTSLGEALVRAAVELVTPAGSDAPELQAFVRDDNTRSHQPLTNLGFERAEHERMEVQVQLPEGVTAEEVEIPVFFQVMLPSGKTNIVQQEVWRRPPGLELARLDPAVYGGPSELAKEAAHAASSA